MSTDTSERIITGLTCPMCGDDLFRVAPVLRCESCDLAYEDEPTGR
ncbi:hypothetical protein [Gryllotalpicola ginsengisoli]|nr:hypothetical protein [Gryllotalpicola ginsengisoli]